MGLTVSNPDDAAALYKSAREGEQSHLLILAVIAMSLLFAFVLIQVRGRRLAERLLREGEERWASLQDEERARIARELHDSTAQHLTAIGLNLMRLREGTVLDNSMRSALEDMKGSLQEATRELRTYTFLLDPPSLERDGIHRTLQTYVSEFGRRTGLKVKIRSSDEARKLSMTLQRLILRIVQEALANVHRHAPTSRVSVRLSRRGKLLHLLVRDDGRRSTQICSVTMAMQSLALRVERLGGRLVVRSRSSGTAVHVVVPIRRAAST